MKTRTIKKPAEAAARDLQFYKGEFNVEYYDIFDAIEGIESVIIMVFGYESDEYKQLENHVKEFTDWLREIKTKLGII